MISASSRVRYISTNSTYRFLRLVKNMSKWSNPQEIRIPIPYGHIAAKAWGKEHHEPVLALHGWQDNAGTFDRLIPLLNQDLYIVAVDSPGHGLSSHKPTGTYYHFIESLTEIKRIVDYLKWDTFSIIGHSLGGTMAILFSSIFPERVKNVVLLDIIKTSSYDQTELCSCTKRDVEDLLRSEAKLLNEAPVYSLEEAHNRLIAGLYNQVTSDSAHILLKRGCRPSKCGKGVVFSRDIRVQMKSWLQKFSHDDLKTYYRNLKCNLLIILAKETPAIFKSRSPEVIEEFLNLYKETCKSFQLIEVDGNHFVHINYPERIAPHLDLFFEQKCLSKI